MTVAVVVHVEADRPYVDSLKEKLEGVRLIACAVAPKTPVMAFDPRLPLVVVWSKHALEMGAAAAFAALARAHRGEIVFCVSDEAQRPRAFEKLRGAVVNGSPRSSFFPGGLSAALTEAHRRQLFAEAAGVRARAPAGGVQRAFTDGMARGLAGSVALFGMGGAAALAVEQIPEGLLEPGQAAAPAEVAFLDVPSQQEPVVAEEADLWAESEVIVVDASLADVPLANPAPARVAAAQRAAFRTSVPLEVWTPDEGAAQSLLEFSDSPDLELVPWDAPQETEGAVQAQAMTAAQVA
ncbi:MAG: hypothetical protein AB7J28_15990 [Hyphomonadaceae bacterium]